MDAKLTVLLLSVGVVILYARHKSRMAETVRYINQYYFPRTIKEKLLAKYPHLTEDQLSLVIKGLRDYFWMCKKAGRSMVAMPSQVVDVAWHEFILFTRDYKKFCDRSFGRFLHHTPTEAMKSRTLAQDGIKRAWRLACAKEKINPRTPAALPLIFAIDGLLNIPDGFRYALNCSDPNSPTYGDGYCASHIGCSSGCGGSSGGDGGFFGGDSGCSGSGCGGGCGGD